MSQAMPLDPYDPYSSVEICEALVRHVEVLGEECFGKHFEKAGQTVGAVFCMVGPCAQEFRAMVEKWLDDNGFHERSAAKPGSE